MESVTTINGHHFRLHRWLERLVPDDVVSADALRGLPSLEREAIEKGERGIAARVRSILLHPNQPDQWEQLPAA